MMKGFKVPIVLLGQQLDGYPCIFQDDYKAAVNLTEQMVKTGKKLSFSMLPRTVAGLFCCIPFTSIVCCILLIEIAKRSISGELVVLCLAVIFTIFICNYLVFLMMEKYTEVIEKRREEEMDRQKAAYKEEYYRELEVYVDKINAVRHDLSLIHI